MWKRWMVALALIAACGDDSGSSTPKDNNTGKTNKDASTSKDASRGNTNTDDEGDAATGEPSDDPDAGEPMTPVDNGKPPAIDDAGSIEVTTPDGGTIVITPGQDAGPELSGMGSCCEEHATGGCNNTALMVCVCEKNETCCTKEWTKGCAFFVQQKYCQDGVRDCVEMWSPGCKGNWTSSCDTVAKNKCMAVQGCF